MLVVLLPLAASFPSDDSVPGMSLLGSVTTFINRMRDSPVPRVPDDPASAVQNLLDLSSPADFNNNDIPCPHNCYNRGICRRGNCECYHGWNGTLCDQPVAWCLLNCRGHGICNATTIECECFEGFDGDDCGLVSSPCPKGCMAHGICDIPSRKCLCSPGFSGVDCSLVVPIHSCPNACSLHGSCLGGMCQCDSGFVGFDCSVIDPENNCPKHCSGHGRCVNGQCECEPGITGADCSGEIEILPIDGSRGCPSQCSGRGLCVRGLCRCSQGWSGDRCDQKHSGCPFRCSGHGSCGEASKCVCAAGFSGAACEVNLGDDCPSNCNGLGSCHASYLWASARGSCVCYPSGNGTGNECNQPTGAAAGTNHATCLFGCSGRGRCVSDGVCACDLEFSGPVCDRPRFDCPHNCSGMGVCFGGVCSCVRGQSGFDCSISSKPCPDDCSEHGLCANGLCECSRPYTGLSCNITCPTECSNHGECFHAVCMCQVGWAGEECSMVDSCPNDCNGNGVCLSGTCECSDGWSGEDCSFPGSDEHTVPPSCSALHNCSGHGWCVPPDSAPVPIPRLSATGSFEIVGRCNCDVGWTGGDCSEAIVGIPRDTRCKREGGNTGVKCAATKSSGHVSDTLVPE